MARLQSEIATELAHLALELATGHVGSLTIAKQLLTIVQELGIKIRLENDSLFTMIANRSVGDLASEITRFISTLISRDESAKTLTTREELELRRSMRTLHGWLGKSKKKTLRSRPKRLPTNRRSKRKGGA